MTKEKPKHDLEDRTAKFGEAVIEFAKKIPINQVTMARGKGITSDLRRYPPQMNRNFVLSHLEFFSH